MEWWVKLLLITFSSLNRAPVAVPSAPFVIQHHANMSLKTVGNGQSTWVPAIHGET